jgi:hypothetical protein
MTTVLHSSTRGLASHVTRRQSQCRSLKNLIAYLMIVSIAQMIPRRIDG